MKFGKAVRAGILVVLGLVIASLFAGCQRGDGRTVLRFAHVYELTAPTHYCGAEPFAQRINEAEAGLDVRVFPASQLGSEAQLLEQLATGQLEMAIAGPSFLAMWHEQIGALDAAYAFDDVEHLMEVSNGPIGQALWDRLREEHGIRVLGTWYYGVRHVTSNRPVRTPEDMRGFRLRMPDAQVWQETGRSLGASPMPIPFSEVYLALQQGIADGQENPIPTIQAMGFHEVQRYLNLTGHIYSATQVLMSERTWQQLDEEQRRQIEEMVHQIGEEIQQCIADDERRILEQWQESGALQVVDDVQRDAFRRRAEEHFSEGRIYSDLYRQIRQMRQEPSGP